MSGIRRMGVGIVRIVGMLKVVMMDDVDYDFYRKVINSI